MKKIGLPTVILLLAAAFFVHAADNMKAFPAAEKGMVRYVLQLPQQSDEALFKVELIVGKIVQVDKENRYFFSGKIESQLIQGWGFNRYVVTKIGPMAGTLMAVDPNTPKIERFVALGGEPYLIRYNSRLPVVVYVPEDAEVRYRIWSSAVEMNTMEKM